MAQSYDRRINLYINVDGKQVSNNVKSVRAELTKIVNAQKLMTIGSQEYQAATRKMQFLQGVLAKHNAEVQNIQKSWSMKGMADGFNRYMGLITAFAASATGLVVGFKQIIQTFNDYEERVDNLSALTGLAGDNLNWLSQKAKDLSTSTLEGGIRVTQSAQDIIDAFTKTGSARPELLKNKEALVETTKEAIILSNAAKTELYPAIEALTMVMNQYNVPATEARRIINALAAGSKEGAGEIPYLTAAFEKAGTVASIAGISIETMVAAIETLAPRISQPEIAGRSLKGVLIDMQTGADDTNPAIVGLSTALENLAQKNLSVTELTKKFGTENIATVQILLTNIAEMKRYEAAVTGTNIAIEQAAINTDNNNAKLAQAKNRLNVMSIELGEKLAPALQISTNGLSYFIRLLTITLDFVGRNKVLLGTLTAVIIGYTIGIKLAAMWEAGLNKERGIGLAITKLSIFWNRAASSAMLLYQAAVALLSGNIARATRAMQLFWAMSALNPIGAITAIVVGLGAALYFLSGRLTAAQKATKMLNDVNLEAKKNIVEEKIALDALLDMARNEKLSKLDRFKAIQQLNAISPKYLSSLTLETINTKAADDAIKNYTDSLLANAKAQAAKEKLVEIEKELLDLQSGKGAEVSFWQGAGNAIISFGDASAWAARNAASATKNLIDRQAELNIQKEKLIGITKDQAIADFLTGGNGGGDNGGAQDLIKLKEKELADAKEIIATTPAEIAARNAKVEAIQKEINALNELGTTKGGKSIKDKQKEDAALALAILDESHAERMAKLTIQYEQQAWTDAKFKDEQLAAELAYLTLKKALLDQFGQSTLQTEAQISQARVDMQKGLNTAISDAENELIKQQEETDEIQNEAIEKSIDATNKALDSINNAKDDEKSILEERQQAYMQFALAIGQSFGNLMMDQEATFADYLKNTILMALDAFHQWFLIEKMKKIIEGISGGPIKAAIAIAKVAAMEIAYQSVRAAVTNAGKSPGRAKGGFMQGEQTYTVSEAGPEWIAPAWMLKNPATASIIANMENWRQNPVSVSSGAVQASQSARSFSPTGYSASTSTAPMPEREAVEGGGITSADILLFREAVKEFADKKLVVYTELIKKDLDTLKNIEDNRGM